MGVPQNFEKKIDLFLTFCEAFALFTPLWIRCLLYGPGTCSCQCSFWKEGGDTSTEGWASAQTSWSCILEEDGCFSLQDRVLTLLVFLCAKILSSISLQFILRCLCPQVRHSRKGFAAQVAPWMWWAEFGKVIITSKVILQTGFVLSFFCILEAQVKITEAAKCFKETQV